MHDEELHKLYTSQNIIRVIKLRMRWAGYVACIGELMYSSKFDWKI